MILRRFAEAVREQNWFQVMLEVAIVVVGIFLGLQVDNWNQARKDRIEERHILSRLHGEMETSVDFLQTIWKRQQEGWQSMMSALDVVFARSNRDELSDDECGAIGRSGYLTMVTVDLPSLKELTSSGRLTVISDINLRLAIARLQQLSESNKNLLDGSRTTTTHLFSKYPDKVRSEGYWSEEEKEVRLRFRCDLQAMRADRGFRNDLSLNADSFDGFYNQGVRRELAQLERIHDLVDEFLSISH